MTSGRTNSNYRAEDDTENSWLPYGWGIIFLYRRYPRGWGHNAVITHYPAKLIPVDVLTRLHG